jgi:hypothetical protein
MRQDKMRFFRQGGSGEVEHLLSDRVQKPRSVFTPGARIKMNVVPMFLGVFIPWGIYIFCCGLTSFSLNYSNPSLVRGLLALVFAAWVGSIFAAVWARHRIHDPTWVTYLALVIGIAAIAGTICGEVSFSTLSGHYYRIRDLKVVSDVDASFTAGKNLLDAGIVHFAPGNHFDDLRTWHFTYGSTWCVAPLVTNRTVPLAGSYDFWIVGRDCCSLAASDFRCGDWYSARAPTGVRVVDDDDLANYRLAVQQAESLYDITAANPVFLTWHADPEAEVSSWALRAYKRYNEQVWFALVCSLFAVCLATVRFSFIGRGQPACEAPCV